MSAPIAQCPPADVLETFAVSRSAAPEIASHFESCDACRSAIASIRDNNRFLSLFAVDGSLPAASTTRVTHEITIPGYELVREIHRGGQGVVYQAVQRSTRRDVAIKVMRQGPFATLADRAR